MDLKLTGKTALVTGSTAARGLANLAKGTGVTVNSVLPGPLGRHRRFPAQRVVQPGRQRCRDRGGILPEGRSTSLIQRMLEAEEIAGLVAFVASPLASGTTGASLRVEGGIVQTIA